MELPATPQFSKLTPMKTDTLFMSTLLAQQIREIELQKQAGNFQDIGSGVADMGRGWGNTAGALARAPGTVLHSGMKGLIDGSHGGLAGGVDKVQGQFRDAKKTWNGGKSRIGGAVTNMMSTLDQAGQGPLNPAGKPTVVPPKAIPVATPTMPGSSVGGNEAGPWGTMQSTGSSTTGASPQAQNYPQWPNVKP